MPQRTRGTPTSTSDLQPPRMRSDVRALTRSGPARPPTAETEDLLRAVLEQHIPNTIAEVEDAKRRQAEAVAAAAAAKVQAAADAEAEAAEMESMMSELLDRLEAAEARATQAEQQAIYAGQQAAQAAEQLMHTAGGQPQAAVVRDAVADVPERRSSLGTAGGWVVAVLALGLSAGAYAMSYRPLRAQLDAQTQQLELQTKRSSETESALRASFDRERETLAAELAAARAQAEAATAAAAAPAETAAGEVAADGDESAGDSKASKAEARAAKREAWLAKKAERAAKKAERSAAKKARGGSSADDEDDSPKSKSKSSESKHKPKPAAPDTSADELGSDDPLEGL